MDELDFNKIIEYEPYFSCETEKSETEKSENTSLLISLSQSEKDKSNDTSSLIINEEKSNDFACKSCDVFCKCPESVGLKKKCYYCLWSTTCTRFELVCINCTRDVKDCFCKKPFRITKAEYVRQFWVTEDNEYFSVNSNSNSISNSISNYASHN